MHSTLEPCEDSDFTFPVHFNLRDHTIYVRCRPYLKEFLERVASMFEIIIFTASQSIYAEQLLNVLDPKRRLFRHRVYRESCVYVEGNYLKDLSVLGRDLSRVVIVDNSPQVFIKPYTLVIHGLVVFSVSNFLKAIGANVVFMILLALVFLRAVLHYNPILYRVVGLYMLLL